MKTKISIVLFALGLILIQKPLEVIALDVVSEPVIQMTDKEYVESLVDTYAKKYKVSKSSMMKTLVNENIEFKFDQQSNLKYKKGNRWGFPAGVREKSYGIAQIHLPDHPDVSYEEAIDPEFAVEFMAKNFAKGNASWWMGYEK